MKLSKRWASAVAMAVLLSPTSTHAFSLNLGGGLIQTEGAGTNASLGALIQLLISTNDNAFSAPIEGNFAPDDDVVAYQFGLNESEGPGTFFVSTPELSGYANGDWMMLRWFPHLTTSDTAPVYGDNYGQYRISTTNDNSDIAWFVPGDGGFNLYVVTESLDSNPPPDTAGIANLIVVPEPTVTSLIILGIITTGVLGLRRRRA